MALGTLEIVLILFIILLLFGPKKLPELARSIGKSVSAYKEGLNESDVTQKKKKTKKRK
ncbi:twin-arginine translocase TatA/TatE family subunit [Candidatus Woesearchaeota archaeon]|nr:twin-arginine translocase TatA/TatE family subunit [Candidatus Woesearchaeota archaeon]